MLTFSCIIDNCVNIIIPEKQGTMIVLYATSYDRFLVKMILVRDMVPRVIDFTQNNIFNFIITLERESEVFSQMFMHFRQKKNLQP